MRTIERYISVPTVTEILITKEEIIKIEENKMAKTIKVEIGLFNNEKLVETEIILIANTNYESLMSESPYFAQGKPSNEYREIDLWHIIDLIRS